MISDHYQAADEMLDLFRVPWSALGHSIALPNIRFDTPNDTATWARWTLIHADGRQMTLAGNTGLSRFGKAGAVVVTTFTPLGKGLKVPYDAAQVALNAYEGKRTPSDVWFRNVRIANEGEGRGDDKAWWSTVVVADFIYDNIN